MNLEKKVIKIGNYSKGIILDKGISVNGKVIEVGDIIILRDIKLKKVKNA